MRSSLEPQIPSNDSSVTNAAGPGNAVSARRVLSMSDLPEVGAVRVVLDGVPGIEQRLMHAIEGELAASAGAPAPSLDLGAEEEVTA